MMDSRGRSPSMQFPSHDHRRPDSQIFLWLLLGAIAISIAVLNLALDGNVGATLGLVLIVAFIAISVFRPSISLYVLIFLALAVEQMTQDYSWTGRFPYYSNLSNIFPSLTGLAINPIELHLLCIIVGLTIRFIIKRENFVRVIAWKQLLAYITAIIFFILYGLLRGGEFLISLWETRAIIYLVLLMVIVPQILRTQDQVRHMIWMIIAGLGFRAIEVTTHYVGAGFSLQGSGNGWGNHEDSGILATLVVFALAMLLYKVDRKQRVVLMILVPLMMVSIIASDRRTAYAVMGGNLLLFWVIQGPVIQRKIFSYAWKAGIVFALYLGAFWNTNSDNIFLAPAKAIREGFAGDDKAAASASYTSNLYRQVENYDLQRMITERPLLGTGYGGKIDYYMPVPVEWDLGFYITHNQILSVLAKTGVVGFTIFIFFYLSVASEIGFGFKNAVNNHYMQAVLVLVAAGMINHLIFSFFDIILIYYRNNVYLGVLFGLASTILDLQRKQSEDVPPSPISGRPNKEAQHWLLLQPPEKAVIG